MDEAMVLDQLIRMSLEIGKPENDYVILGEGNTSAKIDDEHFFVKSSGKYLCQANEDTFVKVKFADALAMIDGPDLTDEQIKDALSAACADPCNKLKPSIETTFHSFLLTLPGINFVAHTHATAVNSILCSNAAKDIVRSRICPDEIIYCGIEPIFIGYQDPGLDLSRTIKREVIKYQDKHGCNPKEIMIVNHGLVAIGKTAHECEAITAMACKTARMLLGAHLFGGIHYLSDANVQRIYTRPDEAYRQQQFVK